MESPELCGWQQHGGYSSVDVNDVDLKRHGCFSTLEHWSAQMDPGDCLYIPMNWYHQVRSHGSRNLVRT